MQRDIRLEQPQDHRTVEELTREAFWNLYVPGADEHYLVHILRQVESFIPELDFVALQDGKIVGNIIYSKSYIETEDGTVFDTITFGPVSVLPAYHNQGIGRQLIEHSFEVAKALGHKVVVIFGYPGYYSRFGFKNGKDFGITDAEGKYPLAMQVLELVPGALEGIRGAFHEHEAFEFDQAAAEKYDKLFPPKEKAEAESQALFAKTSQTYL